MEDRNHPNSSIETYMNITQFYGPLCNIRVVPAAIIYTYGQHASPTSPLTIKTAQILSGSYDSGESFVHEYVAALQAHNLNP